MQSRLFQEAMNLNCTRTNTCYDGLKDMNSVCTVNNSAFATYDCYIYSDAVTIELVDSWNSFFNTTAECDAINGIIWENSTCQNHISRLSLGGGHDMIINAESICTYFDILSDRCCIAIDASTTTYAPTTTTATTTTTTTTEPTTCPTCVCNENACYDANISVIAFGNSSNCASTLSHHSTCDPVCESGFAPSSPFVCSNGVLTGGSCGCVLNISMSSGTCSSTLSLGSSCVPDCPSSNARSTTSKCTNTGIFIPGQCMSEIDFFAHSYVGISFEYNFHYSLSLSISLSFY